MSQEWLSLDASTLGRNIQKGEIDPVDLAQTYLDAIENHPLSPLIYSAVTSERALAEAAAASVRAQSGQCVSPLDGVPISWKDLFNSAGTPTEAGSLYLKGNVPMHDAEVLANATKAGLVCLGKTHMSELAFSGLGYNPMTATPPCVNDESAVPGGSSSGAAASVAFNLAACGIGSDTGGSVRIPSAWNDLVGLKTTHGLLSLEGVVPLCETFDTVGPLCRSVEDAAHMLAALSGQNSPDIVGASLEGLNFLVLETVGMKDLHPQPLEGFKRAVSAIESAGGKVSYGEISEVEEAMALSACLFTVDAYAQWKDTIEEKPDLVFHEILDRFRAGGDYSGLDYAEGWMKLRALRKKYLRQTAQYNAVIVPTSPILPPNVERLTSDHEYYVSQNLLALRNTRIGNLMGLAGLSLPTGVPSAGIMLLTNPFSEHRLLRTGAAVETALAL